MPLFSQAQTISDTIDDYQNQLRFFNQRYPDEFQEVKQRINGELKRLRAKMRRAIKREQTQDVTEEVKDTAQVEQPKTTTNVKKLTTFDTAGASKFKKKKAKILKLNSVQTQTPEEPSIGIKSSVRPVSSTDKTPRSRWQVKLHACPAKYFESLEDMAVHLGFEKPEKLRAYLRRRVKGQAVKPGDTRMQHVEGIEKLRGKGVLNKNLLIPSHLQGVE